MSQVSYTDGSTRTDLTGQPADQIATLEGQSILVVDGLRARSHYFDGRFLAARDLTREQTYFLTREADIGQASGAGVITGLDVTLAGARQVTIAAGQGTTSAGELCTLANDVTVTLDDVPGLDVIDASAGLSVVTPAVPPSARTGIFFLVLRPVEYSTRTITRYPVATNGKRSSENGDIVEAVAITLVPYPAPELDPDPWKQRSEIARIAFMEQGLRGVPAEALPLAMLRIDQGVIRWLDPHLARRAVAAAHEAVAGLGLTPRPLREAHLLQYDQQLREIVTARRNGAGLSFAATDYFEVLPPAGRMPAAVIDPSDFTQIFFPETMTVTLSIVPDDEVPTLIEESLLSPPIQVAGDPQDLDFTAIQVLVPAPRRSMPSLRPRTVQRAPVIPALPSIRRPIDVLNHLTFGSTTLPAPIAPGDPIAAQWRQLLAAQSDGMIWFTRRRSSALALPIAPPLSPPTGGGS